MKEKVCQWRLKKSFQKYVERLKKEQNVLRFELDDKTNPKFIRIIMEDKVVKEAIKK